METKPDSSSPTLEVKVEQKELESKEENTASIKQEERTPEPDSEDSFTPERVIEEAHRFLDTRGPRVSVHAQPETDRETTPPQTNPREGAPVPEESWGPGYGPYASQGARRVRGRRRSPDPFLFNDTIFLEHDAGADEARDDPMGQLQSRLMCVEHNIETLRTRLTQVVDLRDTQGIRQDHRTIVARLDEVEEYASANTFREFMIKIQRLESMLVSNGGGTVGEAIRVCTRRIDQQQAALDDVRNRMRAQNGNWEWSEENSENVSGRENRTTERRRGGGIPAQGIFRSPMPRPPPPPQTSESVRAETDQQAMQRLFVAYNQCVGRTNHIENRLDQFRHAIQRDATDLALVVHGHDQKVDGHCLELRQLTESVKEAQARITGIDSLAQKMLQREHHVNQTLDRNTHSQTASIVATIKEQEDLRKLVEELASQIDRSQDNLSTPQGETSTNTLLDIGDLKTKVSRLTEQHTTLEGDVSFLTDLHERVEELGTQIVKWNNRLPDLNDDNDEKVPTAIEVQEELTALSDTSYRKFHSIFNRIHTVEGMVGTFEHSREESWEAVSNRVSTLVESSVTSLSGRVTELEHALQSQRTTPVETEDVAMNAETWPASEQVIWAELGKVREQLQDVPRLYELFEKIQQAQQSHEKQLVVLRCFAKQVEQHLEHLQKGASPPKHHRQRVNDGERNVSLAYVPGASASSSAVPSTSVQIPTPPMVSPPPIPIPKDQLSSQRQTSLSSTHSQQRSKPHFSTVLGQVRAGAIRMDITNPEEWAEGDIAVIWNQEAKKVRDIGSLIFETPIQHDYEEGVEVRSLLSSEQLEEMDGRLAVVDVSPTSGVRVVKFWVDEMPLQDENISRSRPPTLIEQRGMETPARRPTGQDAPERVQTLEEVWITMTRILREGNDFPMTVENHHQESGRTIHPQKIRILEDVLYILWNRCETGSVGEQI